MGRSTVVSQTVDLAASSICAAVLLLCDACGVAPLPCPRVYEGW